ncbi:MAG: Crp/Fnr family transcriptional regulator [Gemmatimonas sp.]
MERAHEVLIRNLKEHSHLADEDAASICSLSCTVRRFEPNEDFIRQGDVPEVAALVVSGMAARYHLLRGGGRQYLSFHMAGDLPDAQGLFIERMDHALCAIGPASVGFIPHRELLRTFARRPALGFAIWRETLLDAAIFREAITNNSARAPRTRMAHLFCELYYRARIAHLNRGNKLRLPINLSQLGDALGMSLATVNRTLQQLRTSTTMDFREGELVVLKWRELVRLADFNPDYLHMKKQQPVE